MAVDKRTKEYRKHNRPEDLLKTAHKRYKIMSEADRHNREDSIEDIRFVNLPGAQWSENMKTDRGDRPCYEFNKTRVRCKRIVNDMRDNRPSGKVRAVEGGDVEVAEIYEGLIRNIWNASHGDTAIDYAAEYQVEGGMGCFRVNTDYSTDTAFDQDIIIEMIENPYCLYVDPSARDVMKRDAKDWIFTERISHEEFEERYPDADKVDFESDNEFEDDQDEEWTDQETVRIVEYWYKVPVKKTLLLIDQQTPEGETKQVVVDSESDEAAGIDPSLIKNTREVDTFQIRMFIASGKEILEGPVDWAGRKFPWIMVYGEYKVIEGRPYWWGLPRFAKDAQRSYNVSKTAIAETIAQAPKAKWWATSKQAGGHADEWAEADRKNFPYLIYEADPATGGREPQRMGAADVPVALLQQAAVDNEDLKDVMGLPDASMGAQGDEKSGRAIYARQQQGEISTFNYKDNMAKAVEYTMEILIDLIPEIYDTERELRILGVDGAEDYKRVNQVVPGKDGKPVRINDLAAGRYDVVVTVGPAFATQRQEAAEMYMGLTQGNPEIMQMAGDLIFKSIDLPYADEIADRIKAMLPPQIQQMLNEDTEIPPEVQQMMQQAKAAMEQVQQHGQLVQAAAQELEEEKSLNAQQKAELKTAMAEVKQAKAEFDARIAEKMASLIQKDANLTQKEANLIVKGAEVKEAAIQVGQELEPRIEAMKLESLDETSAAFMKQADAAHGVVLAMYEQLANRSPKSGTVTREGGRLRADVEFDDGTSKSISAVRDKGGLTIVPTEINVGPE